MTNAELELRPRFSECVEVQSDGVKEEKNERQEILYRWEEKDRGRIVSLKARTLIVLKQ